MRRRILDLIRGFLDLIDVLILLINGIMGSWRLVVILVLLAVDAKVLVKGKVCLSMTGQPYTNVGM